MEPIIAPIIIGIVVSVIGGIIVSYYRKKINTKSPTEKSIENLKTEIDSINTELGTIKDELTKINKALWRVNKTVIILAKLSDSQTKKFHSDELTTDLEDIVAELLDEDESSI